MKTNKSCFRAFVAAGLIIGTLLTALCAERAEPRNKDYFKCKYGTLKILDATASFVVTHEDSQTYELDVVFFYEPMTEAEVAASKAAGGLWGMPYERRRSMSVEKYPSCSPCLFVVLGEWPIGQPPPLNSTNAQDICLTCDGTRSVRISPGSQSAQVVQWSATPDGKQFILKGRVAGKGQRDADDLWEWDISFEARTHNWAAGKNGLARREDVPKVGSKTNAVSYP